MPHSAASLTAFLATHPAVIRLELTRVRGSSPRDEGTEMFVAPNALWGTIGGGQLEYMAIDAARAMLRDGTLRKDMDVPLGPEIGQCCGGRVEMVLTRMHASDKRETEARAAKADAALPHVYVMGAGHVGRALADLFQSMPIHCILVDTRPEELALCTADVDTRFSILPEAEVQNAPSGSAFIVLTHDHALDFLLTAAALERGDAAYVGMIGSATKRIKLRNWMAEACDGTSIDTLTCPIGAAGSSDKRPNVIASFVLAEVMAQLTSENTVRALVGVNQTPVTGASKRRGQRLA